MTDQKRDESLDLGYYLEKHVTIPWCDKLTEYPVYVRFVPHSDLAAAESVAKRAVQLLNMIDRGHPDVADFVTSLPAEYFE